MPIQPLTFLLISAASCSFFSLSSLSNSLCCLSSSLWRSSSLQSHNHVQVYNIIYMCNVHTVYMYIIYQVSCCIEYFNMQVQCTYISMSMHCWPISYNRTTCNYSHRFTKLLTTILCDENTHFRTQATLVFYGISYACIHNFWRVQIRTDLLLSSSLLRSSSILFCSSRYAYSFLAWRPRSNCVGRNTDKWYMYMCGRRYLTYPLYGDDCFTGSYKSSNTQKFLYRTQK